MWKRLHVKYPLFLSNFNETNFFAISEKKGQILNFIKIRPVGAELFNTDRQTDMKLIVAFRTFVKAPSENEMFCSVISFTLSTPPTTVRHFPTFLCLALALQNHSSVTNFAAPIRKDFQFLHRTSSKIHSMLTPSHTCHSGLTVHTSADCSQLLKLHLKSLKPHSNPHSDANLLSTPWPPHCH